MENEDIKEFVQKTLGCTCPEEVFQRIECKADVHVSENIFLRYEINVGNKLLIFVVQVDDDIIDQMGPVISQLVGAGTKQRDEQMFNRFRLVLVCTQPNAIADDAMAMFKSLGMDDRVHLHIIGEHEFPAGQDCPDE